MHAYLEGVPKVKRHAVHDHQFHVRVRHQKLGKGSHLDINMVHVQRSIEREESLPTENVSKLGKWGNECWPARANCCIIDVFAANKNYTSAYIMQAWSIGAVWANRRQYRIASKKPEIGTAQADFLTRKPELPAASNIQK